MLKHIEVKNFQSHTDTVLDLHEGVNAIIGPSRNGKTALLRAIRFAVKNKPAGIGSILSHWAKNEKGNQKDPVSVSIDNVTRERGTDFNGYRVKGKELKALGQGTVPDEVQAAFRLDDVNIQQQMDKPFLLGESPGDVARFFNALVNLDDMDFYMSEIDKVKRATNAEIKSTSQEIEGLEAELAELSWIDKAEKVFGKLEKTFLKKKEKQELVDGFTEELSIYTKYVQKLQTQPDTEGMQDIIKQVETVQAQQAEISNELVNLTKQLVVFRRAENLVNLFPDTDQAQVYIKKLETIYQKKRKKRREAEELGEQIDLYTSCTNLVKGYTVEIKELQDQLPDICPLCGGELKNE